MRCLVVEDDLGLAEIWGMLLEEEGFDATVVNDYGAAEQALLSGEFGVVVTDLGLPDGDGIRVAELSALRHPATPVLVVTGSCSYERGELFEFSPNIAGVFRKVQGLEGVVAYMIYLRQRSQPFAA